MNREGKLQGQKDKKGFNKQVGDAIERVGETVSNAGATKLGNAIYRGGNKIEHSDESDR